MANLTRLSSLKGKEKDVSKNFFNIYIYSTMKNEDTEVLGGELNKQDQSPIQLTDLKELLVSLCTIIIVHNTARQRQFSLYSP